MFSILNRNLSLEKMRKMDGKYIYVFAERSWAKINMEGSYPLLVFDSGECMSWEDWPSIQSGGIYIRKPIMKELFAQFIKD